MQRADWLIGSGTSKFVARQVVSLMKNEQQNQNLLLKVDPASTFRNNFLRPATNVFVAGQVDHIRWKTGNIDKNLQRNNVARQVEGFCISYFAAFTHALMVSFANVRDVSCSFRNCRKFVIISNLLDLNCYNFKSAPRFARFRPKLYSTRSNYCHLFAQLDSKIILVSCCRYWLKCLWSKK